MSSSIFEGKLFAAMFDNSRFVGSNGGLEGAKSYLFNKPASEFIEKFQKTYSEAPAVFVDSGYDAVLAYTNAMKNSIGITPAEVKKQLLKISFSGTAGKTVGFNADGLLKKGIHLVQVENNVIKKVL